MGEQDIELREKVAKLEGWLGDKDKRIRELAMEIDELRRESHAHDDRICDEYRKEDRIMENRMRDIEIRLSASIDTAESGLDKRIDGVEDDLDKETSKIGRNVNIAIIVGATLLAAMVTALITLP